MASAKYGKHNAGVGAKPDDKWATPLCSRHHRTAPNAQHILGERKFWSQNNINPFLLALSLWANTGDLDAMTQIAARAREQPWDGG